MKKPLTKVNGFELNLTDLWAELKLWPGVKRTVGGFWADLKETSFEA